VFTVEEGIRSTHVAKWDGGRWSRLGSGTFTNVFSLAASGHDLYAGGYFTNAGDIPANNIAKWNGSSWSALSSGVNGFVDVLAAFGGDLYAAGPFTSAGGVAVTNIARWNGTNWSRVGLGVDGRITAFAASGTDLYVGGNFLTAGGIPANRVARWNGTNWSALGSGLVGAPTQLVLVGTNLYASAVEEAYDLVKWDGRSWSNVSPPLESRYLWTTHQFIEPTVYALAAVGLDLYVGGWFKTPAGDSFIARWDGNYWSGLGRADGTVTALAATDTELFASGFVTGEYGIWPNFARARIGSVAKGVIASGSAAAIRFSGVTGYSYDVQRTTNLTPPITWTTVNTVPLYPAADGSFTFSDTNATSGAAYYRAQLNNVDDDE
jgi:hypothetical protein